MRFTPRFAPSPTGPRHLGHASSARLAYVRAQVHQGRFLLRIEDTDTVRARPEWEALIYEDLAWLGLDWEMPVLRQSDNLPRYDAALEVLESRGLLYPCSCSRADIRAALSAPQEGDPAPVAYPGTCRARPMSSRRASDALRLDVARALEVIKGAPLVFQEAGAKHAGLQTVNTVHLTAQTGDIVIGRKDIGTVSYVLSAVVDDADQGITHVIRGEDLFETTFVQVLLQALLGLPTPVYHHHRLIRDTDGKRLAKRDDARAISKYRAEGIRPQDIRARVGL